VLASALCESGNGMLKYSAILGRELLGKLK